MSIRQEINNQIEQIEEHLRLLREQRDRIPEGHISKLNKYVRRKVELNFMAPNWTWEVVDSFNDNTCGVLFRRYVGTDNGQTIDRSPRYEIIRESIFNDRAYSIIATYATPKGLVLEVREN